MFFLNKPIWDTYIIQKSAFKSSQGVSLGFGLIPDLNYKPHDHIQIKAIHDWTFQKLKASSLMLGIDWQQLRLVNIDRSEMIKNHLDFRQCEPTKNT